MLKAVPMRKKFKLIKWTHKVNASLFGFYGGPQVSHANKKAIDTQTKATACEQKLHHPNKKPRHKRKNSRHM